MTDQLREPVSGSDLNAETEDRPERGSGRVVQRRQLRRSQVSLFGLALLVIGFGVLLLIAPPGVDYSSPFVIGFGVALIGLVFCLRFLLNGRDERGIGTLGLTLVFTAIGVAGTEAVSQTLFNQTQIIGIALMAFGLAVWIVSGLAVTSARGRTAGTLILGLALMLAGALILAVSTSVVTLPNIGAGTLNAYWPIGALVVAILLLPLAFRRRN